MNTKINNNLFLILPALGDNSGLGHFKRCLSLREHLIALNARNRLISISPEKFSREPISSFDSLLDSEKITSNQEINLIIDAQLQNLSFYNKLKKSIQNSSYNFRRVFFFEESLKSIDLYNRLPNQIDVVPYLHSGIKLSKNLWTGFGLSVINEKFYNVRAENKDKQFSSRILITAGGVDFVELTLKIITTINNLTDFPLILTIVIGNKFSIEYKKRIEDAAKISIHNVILKPEVLELSETIKENDLVISAGGLTKLEMIAAGIPTIVIDTLPGHADTTDFLQARGLVLSSGGIADFSDRLNIIIIKCILDKSIRDQIRGKSKIFFPENRRFALAIAMMNQ